MSNRIIKDLKIGESAEGKTEIIAWIQGTQRDEKNGTLQNWAYVFKI